MNASRGWPGDRGRTPRLRFAVVTLAMFATALAVLVPFVAEMPQPGLDGSWGLALGEAVARRLAFGSAISFTLGPYASLFTAQYHPAVATLTYGAGVYLALAYAMCLRLVTPRSAIVVPLAFCAFIAIPASTRDILLLSSPLLISLATFVLVRRDASRDGPKTWAVFAFVCSAAGLLPLIKGTFVVTSVASTIFNVAIAAERRRPGLALVGFLSPAVATLAFWTIAGQSPAQLVPYLASTAATISGYSEAMGVFGDPREVIAFVGIAAMLVVAVALHRRTPMPLRAFVAISVAFYLFVAFKGGLVRHDPGHSSIVYRGNLMVALGLLLVLRSVPTYAAGVAALAFWLVMEQHADPSFAQTLPAKLAEPFRKAAAGTWRRIGDPQWPRADFDAAIAEIRDSYPFPRLDGPTDIYSYNQINLLAAGNRWSPRPVFQSYAAYDARQLARNAAHLEGAYAPTNVVFGVEPIDDRFPALEDGASWPLLLANYHATAMADDLLVLRRNEATAPAGPTIDTTSRHAMGETVALPATDDLVYARIDIRPTLFGRLSAIVFKTDSPMIAVRLADGGTRSYRLLPRMAASEFLLSPLVEDTDDFARLFHAVDDLSAKTVVSFRILPNPERAAYWQSDYDVAFVRRAPAPAPAAAVPGLPIHHLSRPVVADPAQRGAVAARCDGQIEALNTARGPSGVSVLGSPAEIRGWLFGGAPSDAVALVLTDAAGEPRFAPLRRPLRGGLAWFLKKPALAHAGYLGAVDLTGLSGDYTLGLAFERDGRWMRCTAFDRAVRIDSAPREGR